MSLIPMMRCRDMRTSVAFYTTVLDFARTNENDDPAEYDFVTLVRGGDRLALSRDDGVFGTVVVVATPDVDAAFRMFRRRGLQTPGNPEAPKQVHEGPIDQTWG
jgi:catechol 2,3-dioxygenase-like lactoylglutathione lyase family enzyme